jgi:hypothetical protein
MPAIFLGKYSALAAIPVILNLTVPLHPATLHLPEAPHRAALAAAGVMLRGEEIKLYQHEFLQ